MKPLLLSLNFVMSLFDNFDVANVPLTFLKDFSMSNMLGFVGMGNSNSPLEIIESFTVGWNADDVKGLIMLMFDGGAVELRFKRFDDGIMEVVWRNVSGFMDVPMNCGWRMEFVIIGGGGGRIPFMFPKIWLTKSLKEKLL